MNIINIIILYVSVKYFLTLVIYIFQSIFYRIYYILLVLSVLSVFNFQFMNYYAKGCRFPQTEN